eukprot:2910406-Rhodomonas_salina.1
MALEDCNSAGECLWAMARTSSLLRTSSLPLPSSGFLHCSLNHLDKGRVGEHCSLPSQGERVGTPELLTP